jgi:hypothetical protein
MAINTSSQLGPALTQRFALKLAHQYNRETVLASEIGVEADGIGNAKNVAWDVVLPDLYAGLGQQAGNFTEGTPMDPTEFTTDTIAPAILPWGQYRNGFAVTEMEFLQAFASVGGGPVGTTSGIFAERVLSAASTLMSLQNKDLWTGTGSGTGGKPCIVGFMGGALSGPGSTYATVNRTNYPSFSGNFLANGGVGRPLTFNLLSQLETNIFIASGQKPTKIVASPNVWREYSNLFEPLRRFNDDINVYSTSTDVLMWRGIPVIRDKDGYEGDGYGSLLMINENYVTKTYLPFPGMLSELDTAKARVEMGKGFNGKEFTPTGVPFRIVPLFRDGDYFRFMLTSYVQLKVTRPNTCGYITDITINP